VRRLDRLASWYPWERCDAELRLRFVWGYLRQWIVRPLFFWDNLVGLHLVRLRVFGRRQFRGRNVRGRVLGFRLVGLPIGFGILEWQRCGGGAL
jgi:hypothetical protein